MSSKDLSQTYQKKTDIEHIKDAPDTYIGSVEPDSVKNWSFNGDNISYNTYDWVPGLYKLFDEGIVNCRDHVIRLQQWKKEKRKNICPVTTIDITVDKQTGMITMLNDGNGIIVNSDFLIYSLQSFTVIDSDPFGNAPRVKNLLQL